MTDILLYIENRIATITLDRPSKANALNAEMHRDLCNALTEADRRNDVSCVVLKGAGKHFCAGGDLASALDVGDDSYRQRDEIDDDIWHLEQGQKLRMALFDMHKPVICQVHGSCLGIGTALMSLSDIAIVATDARIGFPPVRDLGVPPECMWVYQCGPQWTKRLLLTGDSLTGADAAEIGLALKALPQEQLNDEVASLARRMALIDPHLLAANKRAVNLTLELMGARTAQRLFAELDGRGRRAPSARAFRAFAAEHGVKAALDQRDRPFGSGYAAVRGPDPE